MIKHSRYLFGIAVLLLASLGFPALAADRVRPGQWVGTTVVGGATYPTSSCLSPSDAAALNGDAKAVQGYLESIIPPEICKIADVKVDGGQIIYTASCQGGSKIVTTSYHGDRSEGTDSTGGKTEAKRVGPCKP